MYFGVDYYPEQWVFPFGGSSENPEAQWQIDAELMVAAGLNVVRIGEFSWGLCETEDGKFDFDWLRRVMDVLGENGIQVILGTPTAAPPAWLTKNHPEILPVDERGLVKHGGTRRAVCLNSNVYWDYARRIVEKMALALGDHPQLLAWQLDNSLGGNFTEATFNEDTCRDWHLWLEAKYENIQNLNQKMGLRHWGQIVTDWNQVPMPMAAPTQHNPALVLDWNRFCSDTIVQFAKMQAEILHAITPDRPVTTNLRALRHRFDHFDLAEQLDFVSIESSAAIKAKPAENACEIDMLRSLKKTDVRAPDGNSGFWVMEQKAGNVNWQEVNSIVRPGVLRMFTYQLIGRGANAVLFFRWRQPRFGSEKFHGAVLPHNLEGSRRVFDEIARIGEELKALAPVLQDTQVVAEACILYSHDNEWTLQQPHQPSKFFSLRDHIQLYYNALHDRNILVDFARPSEDLFKYKVVIAPSLHLLSSAQADRLKLYVQNGGTLISTFNTGLVDENSTATSSGFPHDLTDLFGLEVQEFDMLPPNEDNHLIFRGGFPTSQTHPAKIWCDLIKPNGCQILATYSKDFYAGKPAITLNTYGLGKAIYIGTQSHQLFYHELVNWLRQSTGISPLLKVPENVEVSMREKEGTRIYFLLNHQNAAVRLNFHKPMNDFLTREKIVGSYDLPPHGVLILDEHWEVQPPAPPTDNSE